MRHDLGGFLKIAAVGAAGLTFVCAVGGWSLYQNRLRDDMPICETPSQWYAMPEQEVKKATSRLQDSGRHTGFWLERDRGESGYASCSQSMSVSEIKDRGVLVQLRDSFLGIPQAAEVCVAVQPGSAESHQDKVTSVLMICPRPPDSGAAP